MTTPPSPVLALNDGFSIPQLGLGVYKIPDEEAAGCVEAAIGAGYRHLDTAALYRNEKGVGDGLRASGVPRDEVFVTTKVWNDDQGYDETLRAFDDSATKLGLEQIDLYLIHWPVPSRDRYVDTYRALERLRADGRVRSIGVSNFPVEQLDRLLQETEVTPVINQIELHPWLPQQELREYGAAHDIVTESWSPLARGRALDASTASGRLLAEIAEKHGKSPAQIVIRWHLQLGVVVIPKSVTPSRIRENIDVFDFVLDGSDLARIARLETGERTGMDPARG